MDKIRVILANGNPTTLTDLECILTLAEEIEVAAIARSGLEKIRVVKKHSAETHTLAKVQFLCPGSRYSDGY